VKLIRNLLYVYCQYKEEEEEEEEEAEEEYKWLQLYRTCVCARRVRACDSHALLCVYVCACVPIRYSIYTCISFMILYSGERYIYIYIYIYILFLIKLLQKLRLQFTGVECVDVLDIQRENRFSSHKSARTRCGSRWRIIMFYTRTRSKIAAIAFGHGPIFIFL